MKKSLRKLLPYLLVVVLAVVATKIIDKATSTDTPEVDQEKIELIQELNALKIKFREAEEERIKTQKENQFLRKEIEVYEIENDTTINLIRDAAIVGDHAKLDSIGESLLDKIKLRDRR